MDSTYRCKFSVANGSGSNFFRTAGLYFIVVQYDQSEYMLLQWRHTAIAMTNEIDAETNGCQSLLYTHLKNKQNSR